MKVAIPTFGRRVSPRFDCAPAFLILTVQDGASCNQRELSAAGWAPHERVSRLLALGVQSVVCGGIDRRSAESLESAGVSVHAQMMGEVEEVLAGLTAGTTSLKEFTK
jgi:predicted Fe-Mo cluster-binding NifX family protein